MQYEVGDIVEILNTFKFSIGQHEYANHNTSTYKKYPHDGNFSMFVGSRFRVLMIEKDGTLHFEGGGCAAPSSVMLYNKKTDNT